MIHPRFTSGVVAGAITAVLIAGAAGFAAAQTAPSQADRAQLRAMTQACRPDVQRLCEGVRPGEGRILACLYEQADRVSAPCRDAMERAAELRAQRGPSGASLR